MAARTVLQSHIDKWRTCTNCPLYSKRKSVVLVRGQIPCDVLFVGEAPGKSEDVLGVPFIGPAGKLLDDIIEESVGEENLHRTAGNRKLIRVAFTNLIACIPLDEDRKKTEEPSRESIKACNTRLVEFVRIAKPRAIVLVGKLSARNIRGESQFYEDGSDRLDWLPAGKLLEFLEIEHPAFLLRMNLAQRGLAKQRCVVQIANLLEAL